MVITQKEINDLLSNKIDQKIKNFNEEIKSFLKKYNYDFIDNEESENDIVMTTKNYETLIISGINFNKNSFVDENVLLFELVLKFENEDIKIINHNNIEIRDKKNIKIELKNSRFMDINIGKNIIHGLKRSDKPFEKLSNSLLKFIVMDFNSKEITFKLLNMSFIFKDNLEENIVYETCIINNNLAELIYDIISYNILKDNNPKKDDKYFN